MRPKYVCSRCGIPCGLWFHGWKHHAGGGSKPTCGQKPDPIEVSQHVYFPLPTSLDNPEEQ